MLRTSYSQILNSSRDFSTAICDLDGRLIAQAEHVPIHVGALALCGKSDDRVLWRRHPSGRRLSAQRSLSRRQSPARPYRLRAGVRGRPAALLVDQPRASERHRRRHARRLQRRGHRHLAGGPPHHAVAALRPRRGAPRPPRDDRDQCASPARLPRRPRRDDRLGACRRAAPPGIGGASSAGRSPMRRSRRYSTAPSAKPGRRSRDGRTASTRARHCSTTTGAATTTSTSARPSPNAAAI